MTLLIMRDSAVPYIRTSAAHSNRMINQVLTGLIGFPRFPADGQTPIRKSTLGLERRATHKRYTGISAAILDITVNLVTPLSSVVRDSYYLKRVDKGTQRLIVS